MVHQQLLVKAQRLLVVAVQILTLAAGTDTEHVHIKAGQADGDLAGLFGVFQAELFEIFPGGVLGQQLHTGVLEQLFVLDEAESIGADVDAVELTVEHAAGQSAVADLAQVDLAGFHQLVQIHQQALIHISLNTGVVLTDHIGQITGRGQRVHLNPVVIPAQILGLVLNAGGLGEHIAQLQLEGVGDFRAPPRNAQGFIRRQCGNAHAAQQHQSQKDRKQFFHESSPPCQFWDCQVLFPAFILSISEPTEARYRTK